MAKSIKKAPPKSSGPASASPKAAPKAAAPKVALPKKAAQAAKAVSSKAAAPKAAAPKASSPKASSPKASSVKATSPKVAAPKSALKQANVKAASDDQGPMLEKLFYDELRDIYYAEKLLVKSLPRLRKAATSDELKTAFDDHIAVTKEQVSRLEEVFEHLGKRAQAKKCEAMEGLTKEAEGVIEDTQTGTMTRDVGLIIASQKIEHYEIASYGGLAQLAKTLGLEDIKNLLAQSLEEEKQADLILTEIAESNVNTGAEEEDDEEEEEEDDDEESEDDDEDEVEEEEGKP